MPKNNGYRAPSGPSITKGSESEGKMQLSEDEIREKIIKDTKPWGGYKRYVYNERCTVKIITVNPNQMLSVQAHKQRDELWIILDEGLRVELDDKIIDPEPGDEIFIQRNNKHRLSSRGKEGRVLEIAFGHADEKTVHRPTDLIIAARANHACDIAIDEHHVDGIDGYHTVNLLEDQIQDLLEIEGATHRCPCLA